MAEKKKKNEDIFTQKKEMKKKVGKPLKYTPESLQKACDDYFAGATVGQIYSYRTGACCG